MKDYYIIVWILGMLAVGTIVYDNVDYHYEQMDDLCNYLNSGEYEEGRGNRIKCSNGAIYEIYAVYEYDEWGEQKRICKYNVVGNTDINRMRC